MKKATKIVPIIVAFVWAALLLLAVFDMFSNYRVPYILATATLVITYILDYLGELENDRTSKRPDNEQGRESEPDTDN